MTEKTNKIEIEYPAENLRFELSESADGKKFFCSAYKIKSKAKFKFLPYKSYYFLTEQRRKNWIDMQVSSTKERIERRKTRKAQKSMARQILSNPFKVGDMFSNSWGYDQTNVDFYQITRVSAKAVWLRKIAGEFVPNTQGFMSSYVRPVKDQFTGKEFRKNLQVGIYGEKAEYYISMRHGCMSPCTEESKLYSSWYA